MLRSSISPQSRFVYGAALIGGKSKRGMRAFSPSGKMPPPYWFLFFVTFFLKKKKVRKNTYVFILFIKRYDESKILAHKPFPNDIIKPKS